MDDWLEVASLDGHRTRMHVETGRMLGVSRYDVPSLSGINGRSTCSWQEREVRGIRIEGYIAYAGAMSTYMDLESFAGVRLDDVVPVASLKCGIIGQYKFCSTESKLTWKGGTSLHRGTAADR
jgi:hypothetical protein